jgi:hypothetical protein
VGKKTQDRYVKGAKFLITASCFQKKKKKVKTEGLSISRFSSDFSAGGDENSQKKQLKFLYVCLYET